MIAAAGALLRERGVEGVSLRAAATHAGVLSAAPYRHFEDKRALLLALALAGYDQLITQVKAAPQVAGNLRFHRSPGGELRAFRPAERAAVPADDEAGISDREHDADLTKAHNDMCNVLIEAVDEAQRRKNVAGNDPVGVAMTAWCMVYGLATLAADGSIDGDAVEAEVVKSLRIVGTGLSAEVITSPARPRGVSDGFTRPDSGVRSRFGSCPSSA
ncbi:TetR/AcrR family transcriptional regulator [Kribbella sancticallisti]|uniref:TetR/AcrR family transcriptional regulator n=1 Tax=Kribbella sancticallisti TaxID=460087 RepID=A0ABN2EQ64_9ACTN